MSAADSPRRFSVLRSIPVNNTISFLILFLF